MYSLPHPHNLLVNPPAKDAFKNTVKKAIVTYWENLLKEESSGLVSLRYFGPVHSDLQRPHYVWMTAGNNPYETHKSIIVVKMLSGRYRTDYMKRHWSTENKDGFCTAQTCQKTFGTLEQLLVVCPAVETIRSKMKVVMLEKFKEKLVQLYVPLY